MITYLQKFNKLEPELKAKVSGEKVMSAMKELEAKYGVKLATIVMRLMVKDVSILDLAKFLKFEYDMEARQAEDLVEDMKEKVLWEVAEYLGFSLDDQGGKKPGEFKSGLGASTIKTSDFFFSSEDEAEVKELTKKLETFEPVKKVEAKKKEDDQNISEIAKATREKMNMNFSAQELNERFEKIVKTYIKGVRSKVDSMQTMMKSVDSGGLDFNNTLASRALKIADEVKQNFDPNKKEAKEQSSWSGAPKEKTLSASPANKASAYSSLQKTGLRDVDYDFEALKEKSKNKEKSGSEKLKFETLGMQEINNRKTEKDSDQAEKDSPANKEFKIDLEALKKVEQSSRESKSESSVHQIDSKKTSMFGAPIKKLESPEKKDEKSAVDNKQKEVSGIGTESEKQTPLSKPRISISKEAVNTKMAPEKIETTPKSGLKKSSNKPKVEDVKFVPKLTGPIDELKEMTLTDFRRLGINAQEIASKIIQKIDTLEKESYEKRSQAIQAWRESPVNKIYLDLANESINKKKKVNNLIVEWRQAGKEVIKPEEFSAILNLNKQIRF